MTILLVEDDHLQAELIEEELTKRFPEHQVERIATELAFRKALDQLCQQPPAVVVMDVMLRWTDPTPELEMPPEDIQEEGIFRAGLRCRELMQQREETREVPVILYTVLAHRDLEEDLEELGEAVPFLTKESSLEPLVVKISKLLS